MNEGPRKPPQADLETKCHTQNTSEFLATEKKKRKLGVHCLPENATLCSTRNVVVQDAARFIVFFEEKKARDSVLI
jgi:hypothetical protein